MLNNSNQKNTERMKKIIYSCTHSAEIPKRWTHAVSKLYLCPACGEYLFGIESVCPDCGIHFGKPMESVSNHRGYQLKYFYEK